MKIKLYTVPMIHQNQSPLSFVSLNLSFHGIHQETISGPRKFNLYLNNQVSIEMHDVNNTKNMGTIK